MSLIDEAMAETKAKPAGLVDRILAEVDEQAAADVRELLTSEIVNCAAAARVLTKHYGERFGKAVSQQMVQKWRGQNR